MQIVDCRPVFCLSERVQSLKAIQAMLFSIDEFRERTLILRFILVPYLQALPIVLKIDETKFCSLDLGTVPRWKETKVRQFGYVPSKILNLKRSEPKCCSLSFRYYTGQGCRQIEASTRYDCDLCMLLVMSALTIDNIH